MSFPKTVRKTSMAAECVKLIESTYPLSIDQIANALGIRNAKKRRSLASCLIQLQRRGKIDRVRPGIYTWSWSSSRFKKARA